MNKTTGPESIREETRESMIQLDTSESIDKDTIEREIDRRRFADSDYFGQGQQEKALLLLAFVKSVERGFYPEKQVISKVAACFQEVLEHTTHHYSPTPPKHWWTSSPHTTARETGTAFVNAFDMTPNTQSAKKYAEVTAIREKLARADFEHRQANPGKGKLKIESAFCDMLNCDREQHNKQAAARLYRRKLRDQTAGSSPITIAQCEEAFDTKNPEFTASDAEKEYRKHRDRVTELKAYISSTERESMDISVSWIEVYASGKSTAGYLDENAVIESDCQEDDPERQ